VKFQCSDSSVQTILNSPISTEVRANSIVWMLDRKNLFGIWSWRIGYCAAPNPGGDSMVTAKGRRV